MTTQPFKFDKILYNEVIHWLQQKWQRKLEDHEINILIQGYRYGRKVEAENEIKILDCINLGVHGVHERNLKEEHEAASKYIEENEVVHRKYKGQVPTVIEYRKKRYVMDNVKRS